MFVDAAKNDSAWLHHLENIEQGLIEIGRRADDDPRLIQILDEIHAVIARNDLTLKQQLVAVGKLFVEVRDGGRNVH